MKNNIYLKTQKITKSGVNTKTKILVDKKFRSLEDCVKEFNKPLSNATSFFDYSFPKDKLKKTLSSTGDSYSCIVFPNGEVYHISYNLERDNGSPIFEIDEYCSDRKLMKKIQEYKNDN